MPQWIKLFAFTFCVLNAVTMFKPEFNWRIDNGPIHLLHGKPVVTTGRTVEQIAGISLSVGAFAGSILLAIDAYRREYTEPKGMPVALATLGVLTVGIASIVYYLAWGNSPTRPKWSAASRFCSRCVSESTETPAKGLFTVHGVWGIRLVGSVKPCADCGSTVKTRWFFFVVPLIPTGSFRVLPTSSATMTEVWLLTRKLPSMDWMQVGVRYIILVVIAVAAGFLVWL